MRLFDAVRVPGAKLNVIFAPGKAYQLDIRGDVPASAEESVRVIADDCSEWLWKSGRSEWDYNQHYGPLLLPFDKMWIEWNIPSQVHDGVSMVTRDRNEMSQSACYLVKAPASPAFPAAEGVVECVYAHWISDGPLGLTTWAAHYEMHLDSDGRVVERGFVPRKEATDDLGPLLTEVAINYDPAWLAVGLMNCKNVQITETKPSAKLSKATMRRRGVALNSYHVISLPGRPSIRSGKQAVSAAGGAVPMHLVRGHFKTYTAEKPLLGKSTGTYWWGWHARGSEEAGRVDKHYVVGPKDGQK